MVQVTLQRPFPRGREPVFRLRKPVFEGLGAAYVLRILEFPGMYAEVAVGGLEQLLQLIEGKSIVHRQRAQNAQPEALVDQPVELWRTSDHLRGSGLLVAKFRRGVLSSHRISP